MSTILGLYLYFLQTCGNTILILTDIFNNPKLFRKEEQHLLFGWPSWMPKWIFMVRASKEDSRTDSGNIKHPSTHKRPQLSHGCPLWSRRTWTSFLLKNSCHWSYTKPYKRWRQTEEKTHWKCRKERAETSWIVTLKATAVSLNVSVHFNSIHLHSIDLFSVCYNQHCLKAPCRNPGPEPPTSNSRKE